MCNMTHLLCKITFFYYKGSWKRRNKLLTSAKVFGLENLLGLWQKVWDTLQTLFRINRYCFAWAVMWTKEVLFKAKVFLVLFDVSYKIIPFVFVIYYVLNMLMCCTIFYIFKKIMKCFQWTKINCNFLTVFFFKCKYKQ